MDNIKLFLLFMIPGTFFAGLHDVIIRYILRGSRVNERLLLGINFSLSGFFALLILIFIFGFPSIKPGFWLAFGITALVGIFSHWFFFLAFRREEASIISPTRLISPPFVLLTGFLTLGEKPSFWGVFGVLTLVFGLWLLIRPETREQGLSQILKRRGILLGVLGALLFAISFPFDKKAVITSSAVFFSALYLLVLGAISLIIFAFQKRKLLVESLNVRWNTLVYLAAVYTLGFVMTAQALNYSLAAYASSVKRLWPLWAVILSGKFLKEKNIDRKVVATAVMIVGIVIMSLFG